jgi:endo-1,4-beta-mannosidase
MVMKATNKVRLMRRMKMSPLTDADDVCVEYLIKKETLEVRRALNMHVKVDDLKDQKENIFRVRCHVQNKVCSLIIDRDSCTNVVNTELVKKFNLRTIKHLIPYKLQ